ncbi:MAG: cytochrome P450 [Solirubrobacterales bacterium]|nr:cytochrome P450 [Solirubrobacterales bacterium]
MPLPPGPRAPRVVQTARWISRPLQLFESCQRRYGDSFTLRIARIPEMVITGDPGAARAIFGQDRDNTMAPGRTLVLEPVMGPRSVLLLEGAEHLAHRRLMLPPFHGERMRAYETLIAELTDREVASWPRGRPFKLHPRFQSLTLEVILSAVFGVEEGPRREELRELLRRVLRMTASTRMMAFGLFTRQLGRAGPYRSFQKLIDRTHAALATEIGERRADPALDSREDILSLLVAARFEDGSAMDDSDIRDQLMTLLLAGHETTATGLAWTFDLLFRNPEVMESLRARLGDDEGHEYVDAVAQEALRVRPVVPQVGRRLGKETQIGEWTLPAGTDVLLSIYLLHMQESLYPEPQRFRPERFLEGGPEPYSWVPFGGGVRRCLGAAFAQFEMRIVIERILAQVRLSPASDRPERIVRRNVTFSPKAGTPAIAETATLPRVGVLASPAGDRS